jgi:hypothetical protein
MIKPAKEQKKNQYLCPSYCCFYFKYVWMAEKSGKASNATPPSIFKYIQIPLIDS